jgi:hypothetical protein
VDSEFKNTDATLTITIIDIDPRAVLFLYPANRCTCPGHIFIALGSILAGLIPGRKGYAAGQNDYQNHQTNNP